MSLVYIDKNETHFFNFKERHKTKDPKSSYLRPNLKVITKTKTSKIHFKYILQILSHFLL